MVAKKKSAKVYRCPTCGMLVRFDDPEVLENLGVPDTSDSGDPYEN